MTTLRLLGRASAFAAVFLTLACGDSGPSTPIDLGPDPDSPECRLSGNICTIIGNGRPGLGEDGGEPLAVRLYLPQDVSFGPDGAPYILDWNNHRVRTVTDGAVQTVVGTGELGDASDGLALEVSLNHPTHVSFNADGLMLLSAWHNSKLCMIDLETGSFETIAGTGAREFGGDGGPALEALFDLPVAADYDSQGRIWIMDQANQRIRRINVDGTIATVLGPQEALPRWPRGFGGDGGPAIDAMINLPVSQSASPGGKLHVGPDDTVYFADSGNHRIRAILSDGTVTTLAGSGPDEYDPDFKGGYAGDGGPATSALLKRPTDIAIGPDGTLYIADTYNHCVRQVTSDGIISTAAGTCVQRGYGGDADVATSALLDRPYGVEVDADGFLYIADTHNHRIRRVVP